MLRYLALFLLFVGIGVVLLTRPEVKHFFSEPWGAGLAAITHYLVSPWDPGIIRSGNVLTDPDTSFAVSVDAECNGIDVVLLFWAAILAFPVGWKQKLTGLVLGVLGLQALNLVRILSLFYAGQWSRDVFTWAHHNLWQGLMIVGAIALFYLWLAVIARAGAETPQHG